MGSTNAMTLLTPTIIAREALRLLKNNLVMGNLVYRDYEAEFPGSPKKGGTVTIRKPVKFTVTKARTRSTSVITEQSITMSVATQAHVSWQFVMTDLTLSVEEYSERYIRPAAAVLANTVDGDLCALYDDIYNSVHDSTGIVTPATFMVMGKAMQRLDEEAAPPEDRVVVFNPAAHWAMANALTSLYMPNVGEKALRKGFLGTIASADVYMDQNIKVHTTGAFHTTASNCTSGVVETSTGDGSVVTTGSAITLVDMRVVTTRAFMAGDIITVSGVYAVNPMSGESTGALRQFVVNTLASILSVTTATVCTLSITPEMIHTGPYKTIDTLAQKGAAISILGRPATQYPQNLAFHKNAFALAMVPLEKPSDGTWGATVTEDGFSIRIVKKYDIDNDEEICRLDILYGVKTVYPELAVRIWGFGNTTG